MARLHRTIPLRGGTSLIYTLAAVVIFSGFASLGVDVAHVRVTKNQLQHAADASARYAAVGYQTSISAAQNNAVAAAADNTADGATVVVDPNNDVDFGTWDSTNKSFTVLTGAARSGANAIRITCRRTAARGNPVQIWFGALVGKGASDVSADAIVVFASTPMAGIIGLSGITFKNNTFIGSYDSATNNSPTSATAGSQARVGSNSSISGGNNNSIQGNAVLGPGATVSGVTVTGSQLQQSSALATPALPSCSPQSNPGNIPAAYTVSSGTTLPGGNYWFTSLTINANLTFSSPAVIYVNGNVAIGGTLAGLGNLPGNLTIYQYGSNTFGDSGGNGMNITANVLAPNSDFLSKNNLNFYGQAIFGSITAKNNANFYYDTQLGSANGSTNIATVQ